MVIWDLTRKLGIAFTVLAVAVAVLATGISLAMGGSGTWVGPMTGGISLLLVRKYAIRRVQTISSWVRFRFLNAYASSGTIGVSARWSGGCGGGG